MPNPSIKQVTMPSGTTYDLVDQGARDLIASLEHDTGWLGVTTTPLTDGASTNPILINGESVTAETGNITSYEDAEFIFNGTIWQEFGNMGALGDLAYKDSANANYTPTGSVSQPTFSGNEMTATGSFTPVGAISTGSGTANYTPSGSVSQPSFTGSEMTATGSFTPAGTIATGSGTANYTPSGSVSQPSFTGSEMTATGSFTPAGTIATGSGTANYTPSGSCSGGAVALSTDTVKEVDSVGTLPSVTMPSFSVTNEVLTITDGSYTAGTLPTTANKTVATGVSSFTQPTFTGDGVDLEFTGTAGTVTAKGTPSGSVSQPTFSGTGVDLEFTGTAGTVTAKGTPSGSVSQPTFSGTGVDLEFTGTAGTVTATGTPAGTVSQPTFSGTQATITVS